jgi:hypothetical protein
MTSIMCIGAYLVQFSPLSDSETLWPLLFVSIQLEVDYTRYILRIDIWNFCDLVG